MNDVILETAQVFALTAILCFLLGSARMARLEGRRGWGYIVAGVGLLLFGSVLDITENFDELERFVVIGDTAVESVLKNVAGYLGGSVFLLLGFWYRLPSEHSWKRLKLWTGWLEHFRDPVVVVVLCIGGAISASIYLAAVGYQAREHIAHEVRDNAVPYVAAVNSTLTRHLEMVYAVGSLYAASSEVDRGEFRAFVKRGLSREPDVHALEWVPRVSHGEREAYEARAHLDGHATFRITERDSEGRMVGAWPRDEYYPVYFVEPFRGNERALGFDLASDSVRLAALSRARDLGQAVATQGIPLVQESGTQTGFLVFLPVYSTGEIPGTVEQRRKFLTGFVLGVFRVGKLMEAAARAHALPTGFDAYVIDENAAPGERLLHYIPAMDRTGPSGPVPENELYQRSVHAASIAVADRQWSLVFNLSGTTLNHHSYVLPWSLSGLGLLFTLVLAQYLAVSRNRAKEVERLVDERSKELIAANTALKLENTERERMEQALRVSERRIAGILDIARAAVISVDESQRIIMFNKGAEAIFGFTAGEIIGQSIEQLIPSRFRPGHGALVENFAASVEVSRRIDGRGQVVGLRKDCTEFPAEASVSRLESDGEIIFTVMLEDITERKKMQEAFRESEMRFRALVDNSPAAISMKDPHSRFVLTNRRFREWYCPPGLDPAGMTSHDFYPVEHADLFVEQDREVLETGEPIEREIEVSYADGSIHSVLSIKFPIFDSENRAIGIGGINTDVTEQRRAEQQLRQNAKMESLGTLAGGIAHDLNNVLVPVLGLTKLTMRQLPEGDQARTNLEHVLEASQRAKQLVQQILDFSRAEQPERSAVAMDALAREVLSLVRSILPASIEIRQNIEPEVGVVLADATQIHQVLMNLAANAMHAMEAKGGTLEIALARVEVDDALIAGGVALKPGPHARFTIRDTGCGMDEETMKRIFDPFFTTKEVGEGTGMGLAVVHGIVTRHEGAITVASEPGRGTTFELYLPLCEAEPSELDAPDLEKVAELA